jgi:Transposase DDE domain
LSHPEELKRLNTEIASHMGHLSKCFINVLTLYVFGMVIMRHCGQTQIATFLSGLRGYKFGTIKQRLREFTYEAEAKQGQNRQQVDVNTCFSPLLGWVLSKFKGQNRELVLALDATYLRDQFVILAVSVVVSGCAIPVAWHIQEGDRKGSWTPIWQRLLKQLSPAVPDNWAVFTLSDAGLYSKPLFCYLTKGLKWNVLMRTSSSHGLFKARGERDWKPIRDFLTRGMETIILEGICFKGNPISCTLILQWEMAYEHPCILISNLQPYKLEHNIYGIRYWIECSFKDIKRGLLHWEQTKMTCPQRVERLWLVISIALLCLIAIGDEASDTPQWQSLKLARPQTRLLSVPVLGWIDLILKLLKSEPLSYGYFNPYPWLPIPEQ